VLDETDMFIDGEMLGIAADSEGARKNAGKQERWTWRLTIAGMCQCCRQCRVTPISPFKMFVPVMIDDSPLSNLQSWQQRSCLPVKERGTSAQSNKMVNGGGVMILVLIGVFGTRAQELSAHQPYGE
jgi:hypothetical protein